MNIKTQNRLAVIISIATVLAGVLTVCVTTAHAQTPTQPTTMQAAPTPPGFVSWCFTSTKGLEKNAKKLIDQKCEEELLIDHQQKFLPEKTEAEEKDADAKRDLDKAAAQTVIMDSVHTTKTTSADGVEKAEEEKTSFSGTPAGAKHEENMAKIHGKTTIEVAKANRPVTNLVVVGGNGYRSGYYFHAGIRYDSYDSYIRYRRGGQQNNGSQLRRAQSEAAAQRSASRRRR